MENLGNYLTVHGIPIYTYGLIGVTTLLLTYSVFSDDSKPKESESSSSGLSAPHLQSPTKEEEPPQETTPVKAEESPPPPVKTPATVGGKRKRTKRHRNKNKKTKRSRK